ncbi:MAG: hypothetical protein KC983_06135 [Phycisphaerales bacterium]|nr:hypothetical protein [Phycisphaerales bacterium]
MTKMADTFDELAAMFLSPDDPGGCDHAGDHEPPLTDGGAHAGPLVEVLLVGHLPVRGSLWLTPYAERLVDQTGPVTIVRLDGDEPALQLVGHDAAVVRGAAGATWREAILHLGVRTSAWLIRLPSSSNPVEWFDHGVDRVTVLTSGDQAAVAGAYQVLKQAVESAAEAHEDWPRLGLAVVGIDEQRAVEVAESIRRTARECLGVDIELVLTLPRMDVTSRTTRHLEFNHEPMPSLADVLEMLDVAILGYATTPNVPPTMRLVGHDDDPAPMHDDPAHADDTARVPDIETVDADRSHRAPSRRDDIHIRRTDETLERSPRLPASAQSFAPPSSRTDDVSRATPAMHDPSMEFDIPRLPRHPARPVLRTDDDAPASTSRAPEPDAAPPVDTSRATPTDTPEPSEAARRVDRGVRPHRTTAAEPAWTVRRGRKLAPSLGIELESKFPASPHEPVSDHGSPRSLASHVEGLRVLAIRPPKFEHVELAVDERGRMHLLGREADLRHFRRIEQWALAHCEILAMAAGGNLIDVSCREVVSHLFTDQPARVSDLYDSGIRLHVLAPVDTAHGRGWYSAPLNGPEG